MAQNGINGGVIMYLLYESLYGELQYENDVTEIIGLYKTKKGATKKAKELIKNELKNGDYVLDDERKDLENDSFVRFFYGKQENWNCYYEIIITKLEVQ